MGHCRNLASVVLLLSWPLAAQYHVNAGGSGDGFYSGGTSYTSPVQLPAGAAPYFQQERFGNFSYLFPVADGQYTVALHFIENSTAITGPGQRVFGVSINGVPVLAGFDIAAIAGLNVPVDRSFPASAVGGSGIRVQFTTEIRNAVVSAIDVQPVVSKVLTPSYLTGLAADLPPGACTGTALTFYAATDGPDLWFCLPPGGWVRLTLF